MKLEVKYSTILVVILLILLIIISSVSYRESNASPVNNLGADSITIHLYQIPEKPVNGEPVSIILHIDGNVKDILINVECEIGVYVDSELQGQLFKVGPYTIPLIPIQQGWYISRIPALPAKVVSGLLHNFTLESEVHYDLMVNGKLYGSYTYVVSPENVSLNSPPITFTMVYEALRDPSLLNETFGLGPRGWVATHTDDVPVVVLALDDKEIENITLYYSVSDGPWLRAPLFEDPLIFDTKKLVSELNEVIDEISNLFPQLGSITRSRLPMEIYNGTIPRQDLGNYILFYSKATDEDGKSSSSLTGLYYIVNKASSTRVLVIDPNVRAWLIYKNADILKNRLSLYLKNSLGVDEFLNQVKTFKELADIFREFRYIYFHHWEKIGKYFNLYITHPSKSIAGLLKPVSDGGFEPHSVILSNIWLGVNISDTHNFWDNDLSDISADDGRSIQEHIIKYIKDNHAGLIATHGTLSDWVVWAGCESSEHYKLGTKGHVGYSLLDIDPVNERTISSLLGLPLLPLWEVVRDKLAMILCKRDPSMGMLVGSIPLQTPYVPFSGRLIITKSGINHPILKDMGSEFTIEIPDMPKVLAKKGYKAYTQVGWQLSFPNRLADASWSNLYKSLGSIRKALYNVTWIMENITHIYFKPSASYNEMLLHSMKWGLKSYYDSVAAMNIMDNMLTIEFKSPLTNMLIPLEFDYTKYLQYTPVKLIATSENMTAGILAYDKYWDESGYRSIYFTFEVEACEDDVAEKLLKNSVEWSIQWSYKNNSTLLGDLVRVSNDLATKYKTTLDSIPGYLVTTKGGILNEKGYMTISFKSGDDGYIHLIAVTPTSEKINADILQGDAEIDSVEKVAYGLTVIKIFVYANQSITIGLSADPEVSINPLYLSIKSEITDAIPPKISIINPVEGTYIHGIVTVNVDASDNVGIDKVEFYIDGNLLYTDQSPPYEYTWDTSKVPDGIYSIKVVSYDLAGNTAEEIITVTVDNTPPSIDTPVLNPEEPKAYENIIVNVRISDEASGVKYASLYYRTLGKEWSIVNMMLKNGLWQAMIPGQNPNVTIEYYVVAVDNAGNTAKSSVFQIKIIPSIYIKIISPKPGAIISESRVVVEWSVGPTESISSIKIKLDDMPWIDVTGLNTYEFTDLSGGKHVVTLRVIDKDGKIHDANIEFTVKLPTKPTPALPIEQYITIIAAIIVIAILVFILKKRSL